MVVRLVIALLMTVVVVAFVGRRAWAIYTLIRSGQPAPDRSQDLPRRLRTQLVEVFGQKRLLKWTVPGLAHLFTFWAFVILLTVYIEAYGALFDPDFAIPLIGHSPVLGFLQDTIAVLCLLSLGVFAVIRIRNAPERKERASRFYGSHTGGAWLILFMIFNVLWTLFFFRAASSALGTFPYKSGAWASIGLGNLFTGLSPQALEVVESVGLLLHIGVMLAFLIIVAYSKHLHIFVAPINVSAKRYPKALGPLPVMTSGGKPIDFEDPGEDDVFGRGKIEDFTWKGMLDMATCTECGRCQSQCPAWNTGKPLSPKLVIMDLRDHLMAKAPYLIGGKEMPEEGAIDFAAATAEGHDGHGVPESGFERVRGSGPEQAARPLVGTAEQGGVIDPDVLWSLHDVRGVRGAVPGRHRARRPHRRHAPPPGADRVGVPLRAGGAVPQPGEQGQPVGAERPQPPRLDQEARLRRAHFRRGARAGGGVPVLDRLRGRVRRRRAEDRAGHRRAAAPGRGELRGAGPGGDLHRRSGAPLGQRVPVPDARPAERRGAQRRVRGPRAGHAQDRHHVPALPQHAGAGVPAARRALRGRAPHAAANKLVREGKLVPVAAPDPEGSVTYHDPCYLGRHNEIYEDPRALVGAAGAQLSEMPRHADRSMCCGAGGARMWMEERIGQRVNVNRTTEALDTLEDAGGEQGTIAVGCPFCRTMLTDGLTQAQGQGAGENVQVQDVSQLLLAAVKRGAATEDAKS